MEEKEERKKKEIKMRKWTDKTDGDGKLEKRVETAVGSGQWGGF